MSTLPSAFKSAAGLNLAERATDPKAKTNIEMSITFTFPLLSINFQSQPEISFQEISPLMVAESWIPSQRTGNCLLLVHVAL